jgi:hypothetical protein
MDSIKQPTCRVPRAEGTHEEGLGVSAFGAPLLLADSLLQPSVKYE